MPSNLPLLQRPLCLVQIEVDYYDGTYPSPDPSSAMPGPSRHGKPLAPVTLHRHAKMRPSGGRSHGGPGPPCDVLGLLRLLITAPHCSWLRTLTHSLASNSGTFVGLVEDVSGLPVARPLHDISGAFDLQDF